MIPDPSSQPVASLTRDERQLLIYATAYRSLVAILWIAMAAAIVALTAGILSRIDQIFPPLEVQRAANSIWFLAGSTALIALLTAWNAFRIFRSALSLWGFGHSSLPLAIPTRAQLIFNLAYGCFLILPASLFVVGVSAMPTPERYWFAIIGGTVAAAGTAALATAWRARTLLNLVGFVPDVSLVEEPQPYRELTNQLRRFLQVRRHNRRRPASPAT